MLCLVCFSLTSKDYLDFEEGNRIGLQFLALQINKEKLSQKLVKTFHPTC